MSANFKRERVARPELVELASRTELSEIQDVEEWAEKLAADLAGFDD